MNLCRLSVARFKDCITYLRHRLHLNDPNFISMRKFFLPHPNCFLSKFIFTVNRNEY